MWHIYNLYNITAPLAGLQYHIHNGFQLLVLYRFIDRSHAMRTITSLLGCVSHCSDWSVSKIWRPLSFRICPKAYVKRGSRDTNYLLIMQKWTDLRIPAAWLLEKYIISFVRSSCVSHCSDRSDIGRNLRQTSVMLTDCPTNILGICRTSTETSGNHKTLLNVFFYYVRFSSKTSADSRWTHQISSEFPIRNCTECCRKSPHKNPNFLRNVGPISCLPST